MCYDLHAEYLGILEYVQCAKNQKYYATGMALGGAGRAAKR